MLAVLTEVQEGGKNEPDMWYAATCIIVAYLGFLETLIYPVWERDGEPGGRDRSAPPSGQPAGKVEALVKKLLDSLKSHGVKPKSTSG